MPSRRDLLNFGLAWLTLELVKVGAGGTAHAAFAATSLLAVRVWPAREYTRVTLEHDQPLRFSYQLVKDPDRLVLDLEEVELNSVLQTLPSRIQADDPYIKLIRAGRNKPNVVRLVIELKGEVKPQVFSLQPAGGYRHRLVLDLYPTTEVDPLMALLEREETPPAATPAAPTAPEPAETIAERPLRPATRLNERRSLVIVLDPGHGGEDPGAIGYGGSREKDVTLSIAQRLQAKIEAIPTMRCLLTRDGDFYIPLHQRVQKARRVEADLFVSVHADAFIKPTARGSSVFVLSQNGATSSAARWLASKENAADLVGGVNLAGNDPYLARTLLDLSLTATINDSMKLGKNVLGELGRINTLHKNEVEQAGFAVLKAPDIPSILIETAFISNPQEEARLNDERYQDKMADAILKGIRRYFAQNPALARSRNSAALL